MENLKSLSYYEYEYEYEYEYYFFEVLRRCISCHFVLYLPYGIGTVPYDTHFARHSTHQYSK